MNGINRLLDLRREVMQTEQEMQQDRGRFKSLKDAEPARAISSFNLFQTPEHIAERMAKMLGEAGRCLEPSAGLGRLIRATKANEWLAIDINPDCCREVERLGVATLCRDFLSVSPSETGLFDSVIMNPPFKMGLDCKHIMHAMQFLKPTGKLVSLCYNGTKQNAKIRPIASTWEVLPDGSFRSEGTQASVCLITFDSPYMATGE